MKNKQILISLIVWIFTMIIFFLQLSYYSKPGGSVTKIETTLFVGNILVGIIAFLVFVMSLLSKRFKKRVELGSTNNKKVNIWFIISVLLLIFIVWSYINRQTPQNNSNNDKVICTRKEPYILPPEFERARSLRMQRMTEAGITLNKDFYNCINIKYENLNETPDPEGGVTEGQFRIDKNSRLDELTIYVDSSYHANDDILTAVILSHEFTHVSQFISELQTGKKQDCVQSEKEAFANMLSFITTLNEEEKRSLITRLNNYNDTKYQTIINLLKYANQAQYVCGWGTEAASTCQWKEIRERIETMIRSMKSYQEQCNL